MVAPAVIGGAAIAAGAGSSLVNLAFAPLFAANQYIGSYFFGSGMILGERDMYQEDWPKIKARLDAGEEFTAILEEQTIRNTTAIMANARDIVLQVKTEWNQIVFDYLRTMPQAILDLIGIPPLGEKPGPDDCPPGFKWDTIQKRCRPIPDEPLPKPAPDCPPGFRWSESAKQCVPEEIPEPKPDEPKPAPEDPLLTRAWFNINAQGRILKPSGSIRWECQSNNRGRWITLLRVDSQIKAIQQAILKWPASGYRQYGFTGRPVVIYWTLKTKF